MDTSEGRIVIELDEWAAPATVRWLADLAVGSVAESNPTAGYYDGLTFDHTRPRIEIMTAERPLSEPLEFPKEVDAVALGLDQQRISSIQEAGVVLQMELFKSRHAGKRSEQLHPRLRQWLDQWRTSDSPEFLIGVSRQEINETLGYEYQRGLASRPITRGTVTLKPASLLTSSPRLNIALVDLPRRNGQWVAVGSVVEGLELADRVSFRPLVATKLQPFLPRSPVRIESVVFECIHR